MNGQKTRLALRLTEQSWKFNNWTWTNTLLFQKMIATNHDVKTFIRHRSYKKEIAGGIEHTVKHLILIIPILFL